MVRKSFEHYAGSESSVKFKVGNILNANQGQVYEDSTLGSFRERQLGVDYSFSYELSF